jgi:multidrug efflux pump subunit AcrA (membrane-fusion protein)
MKRIWTILAVLVIGGLVAGAGYLGFRSNRPQAANAPAAPLTIAVAVCDVQQTVTAPGSTVNTRTVTLEMPSTGLLAEVLVRAGDAVSEGQILARLANKETYEAAVAAAELELAQAQQALADVNADAPLKAARAQLAYAEAQQELAKAQRALAALLSPDVAYYRQQVDRAQDGLDIAQKNAALTDLASAVRQAQEALADAANALDELKRLEEVYPGGFAEPLERAQRNYEAALENLQNATLRYEQAQINNANAIEDAQAELAEAQRRLAGAQAEPNTAQVALAEAQVAVKQAQLAQAQSEWESLQNGLDALEVSAAQARVDQATAALAEARRALEQLEIKAPFAGVVLGANAATGETLPAATALFTLADPQAVEVETTVIEEDVPYVSTGQPAEVYFDALPGDIITGTVARIVPQRLSGDRPLYHVYLTLSRVPAALFEGMSADASIVIAQREGVLCLPRALAQASADGTASVDVWANGATQKRTITVGLRGDTYVEVLSGLREGEAVVAR